MVQIRLASLAPLQDYQKRKIAKESVEKQQLRNKLIPDCKALNFDTECRYLANIWKMARWIYQTSSALRKYLALK